ncbi:MAG TPA: HupE/UreJ family protein [Chthoniobacteraceae bacterium]|nr:HupE/UreJ family protein [Chthoniobacteraceae bacterium]
MKWRRSFRTGRPRSRIANPAHVAALFLLLALTAHAHNPDTSYARIAIARDRLDLRFTLDLFTLQKIADVDADRDQRVTPGELQRAAPAIERFLRAHVRLDLDGKSSPLGEAGAPVWPRDAGDAIEAKDWHGAASLIAINFTQPLAQPAREVAISFAVFDALGSRHTVLGAFEYAGGSEEVTFTQPEPDYLFDTAYADAPAAESAPTRKDSPLLANLGRFLRLGIAHIFRGYDHICFLIALLVVGRFRELVKIVTSFTVAHSITLILAAMQLARLPSRFTECAIALTIVYVAAENFWRKSMSHRWLLTFGFGLIHGFGFANVLAGLGLPAIGRVRCLLAFNAGVELGQLAIITLAFPLILLLERGRNGRRIAAAISIAVGILGLGWFVERAFGLGFMP